MASALADQQMYAEAIELLTRAGGTKQLRNPSFRHVRLWYALADVYDRSGDVISARELFARVVIAEPERTTPALVWPSSVRARRARTGNGARRPCRRRRSTERRSRIAITSPPRSEDTSCRIGLWTLPNY